MVGGASDCPADTKPTGASAPEVGGPAMASGYPTEFPFEHCFVFVVFRVKCGHAASVAWRLMRGPRARNASRLAPLGGIYRRIFERKDETYDHFKYR